MSWWNTSWTYRKKLTFANNAYEAFTDFPVLVHLKDGGGAGTIDVDFAEIKAGGADIRFVDDNDSTELKYEIERWDDVGEEAWIWVKVPTLAKSDTDFIYIYWGNTAASDNQDAVNVWDSSFQAVYHFNGNVLDSKGNHHGSDSGTSDIAGKIGRARDFNPNDYVSLGDWELPGAMTLEAYVNFDSLADKPTIFSKFKPAPEQFAVWYWHESAKLRYLRSNDGAWPSSYTSKTSGIGTGTWYYCVIAITGTSVQLYVQGASIGTGTTEGSTFNISDAWRIGGMATGDTFLNAQVDEVRMSNARRSSNWIAAQHKSMTDTYITPGGKEAQKIFTESVTLADTSMKKVARIFTETLTLTDTVKKRVQKTFSETISLSDVYSRVWTIYRTFTESLALSDSYSRVCSWFRTFTESITLVDTVQKAVSKRFSEAIALSDTLIKRVAKIFTESITLTDIYLRVWNIYRTFTESLTLTDTLIKKPIKTFIETLHLTDTYTRVVTWYRTFTEKVTLADSLRKTISKTFLESLTLADTLIKRGIFDRANKLQALESDKMFPSNIVRNIQHGLDAAKTASPVKGDWYIAINTQKVYVCFLDDAWVQIYP